jgi:hypothetical protein
MTNWYELGKQQTPTTISALEIRDRFEHLLLENNAAAESQDEEAFDAFLQLMETPEPDLGQELFEKRDLYARYKTALQTEAQVYEDFTKGWIEANPIWKCEVAPPQPGELNWTSYNMSDTVTETTASFWRDTTLGRLQIVLLAVGDPQPDGRRPTIFHSARIHNPGKTIELDCYEHCQIVFKPREQTT